MLVDGSLFQQSQRVVDTETATYDNILYSSDVENFRGNFTCSVSNVRGSSEQMMELNGTSGAYNLSISFRSLVLY